MNVFEYGSRSFAIEKFLKMRLQALRIARRAITVYQSGANAEEVERSIYAFFHNFLE